MFNKKIRYMWTKKNWRQLKTGGAATKKSLIPIISYKFGSDVKIKKTSIHNEYC